MFQQNSILSELEAEVISLGTRAYLAQRARDEFYSYVMDKYRHSDISKAKLAKRIGKSPAQITRILANPGNWTLETSTLLLAGICGEELLPNSKPFEGRAKRNIECSDILIENTSKVSGTTLNVVKFDISSQLKAA
jgi:hypothetical protein